MSDTETARAAYPAATVTGYPRIGPNRELKRALEALWSGKISAGEFETAARSLRLETYRRLAELGLNQPYALPADFAAYDQVLETAAAVGVLGGSAEDLDWEEYFALARGTDDRPALEMTKWFDTNYHYLVPEIGPDTVFTPRPQRVTALVEEAASAGHTVRPVLVGPVTLLALSKAAEDHPNFQPLNRLDDLVKNYAAVLAALAEAGVEWVQLDEPALVADFDAADDAELAGLAQSAYRTLLSAAVGEKRPQIAITASYGSLRAGLDALASAAPEALIVDISKPTLEADPDYISRITAAVPQQTHLVAGIIDGRNIWAADLTSQLETLRGFDRPVSVSTSTSLLHVPYTLEGEVNLPVDVAGWLSFAEEKVTEVEALAEALATGNTQSREVAFARAARAQRTRAESGRTHSAEVRKRTAALPAEVSRGDVDERRAAQKARLGLPDLPTTTIGSFPQTDDVRKARAAFRAGRIDEAEYTDTMRAEIKRVVDLQEDIGLDVIVHGEPERNDMVQYFAENLEGFATTANGWVQSYGSRCTRPPILFGDVSRAEPITVPWSTYAASLTDKPVKGMLTGPVTILAWSFVRDDEPLSVPADQIARALADEVSDLEDAGIPIIQIDEPALRELLPLREDRRAEYLRWAVRAFRLCAVDARVDTQIHTHLCYSEFGQVITAIQALDADVTSIEAARSRMELLDALDEGFHAEIGPGVWDIHSPRVPSMAELEDLLGAALKSIGPDRLWVNPDCGLKTRGYRETEASLRNLVHARAALLSRRESAGEAVAAHV
ncbi:MAG TPA: 5-methyltetrahydropteroyltriglutamate--homocysteine S-methyltransferase [Brevibacterium ravenspurgense]|nr:5-methyltetrahydropteroyltriglutamate--homocysteine S-methyltransferase [Brevibacterium ravenspurgense]